MYAFRGRGAKVGVPYPSAITAIHQLSSLYHFVGLTARWYRAESNTIGWLNGAGLDGLPVIFAKEMHPADHSRSAYKAAAIAYLRNEGWNPIIGIGDRPSDMVAYTAENLRTFMVIHKEGTQPGETLRHTRKLVLTEEKIRSQSIVMKSNGTKDTLKTPSSSITRSRSSSTADTDVPPIIQYFSDDLLIHQYFQASVVPSSSSTVLPKFSLHDPVHLKESSDHSGASSSSTNNVSSSSFFSRHKHHEYSDIFMNNRRNNHNNPSLSHNTTTTTDHLVLPPVWTQIRTLLELEHRERKGKQEDSF